MPSYGGLEDSTYVSPSAPRHIPLCKRYPDWDHWKLRTEKDLDEELSWSNAQAFGPVTHALTHSHRCDAVKEHRPEWTHDEISTFADMGGTPNDLHSWVSQFPARAETSTCACALQYMYITSPDRFVSRADAPKSTAGAISSSLTA
jgi:hypothetical protein